MEIICNVLGLWNPWKVIIIQLDWSKLVPIAVVESHALLWVRIRAEDKVFVLGMLLANADHLLKPTDVAMMRTSSVEATAP